MTWHSKFQLCTRAHLGIPCLLVINPVNISIGIKTYNEIFQLTNASNKRGLSGTILRHLPNITGSLSCGRRLSRRQYHITDQAPKICLFSTKVNNFSQNTCRITIQTPLFSNTVLPALLRAPAHLHAHFFMLAGSCLTVCFESRLCKTFWK